MYYIVYIVYDTIVTQSRLVGLTLSNSVCVCVFYNLRSTLIVSLDTHTKETLITLNNSNWMSNQWMIQLCFKK